MHRYGVIAAGATSIILLPILGPIFFIRGLLEEMGEVGVASRHEHKDSRQFPFLCFVGSNIYNINNIIYIYSTSLHIAADRDPNSERVYYVLISSVFAPASKRGLPATH